MEKNIFDPRETRIFYLKECHLKTHCCEFYYVETNKKVAIVRENIVNVEEESSRGGGVRIRTKNGYYHVTADFDDISAWRNETEQERLAKINGVVVCAMVGAANTGYSYGYSGGYETGLHVGRHQARLSDGHAKGYQDGQKRGYEEGRKFGLGVGYRTGFKEGHAKAKELAREELEEYINHRNLCCICH